MIQLYTVRLHQSKLISRFDMKGKKIEDREELITVTFTDLPLQTAQMYQKTSKEGRCEIIKQDMASFGKDRTRVQFGKNAFKRKAKGDDVGVAPAQPKQTTVQTAAKTGNMAAAINQGA